MKIVHSFWGSPSLKKENINHSDRSKGGWIDKKYNYMSWALSCCQFKKHYDKVELVTDSFGYDLLINKLELPYTGVKVSLDALNDYHPDLWALGKIYAYSIQEEPFIHADGDVYIYKRFDKQIEQSFLLAQNVEYGFNYYNDVFKKIKDIFTYVPEVLMESEQYNKQIIAVNAGILGGTDIDFFKSYTKEVFAFIDKNIAHLDKINIGMFNTIFEQFLFYALAEKNKINVSYCLYNVNHAFDGLAEFTALPARGAYIHTVGEYKRIKYIGDLLAYRLQTDYPSCYYRIINLIRTGQI